MASIIRSVMKEQRKRKAIQGSIVINSRMKRMNAKPKNQGNPSTIRGCMMRAVTTPEGQNRINTPPI